MIASMVKMAFSFQTNQIQAPSDFLEGINKTLCGNLENQFLTAGYLLFSLKEQKFVYSSAAHPPLIHWRHADQSLEWIKPKGTIIGYFPEIRYENESRAIGMGDRIILYTDGILEAENDREEAFGENRLGEIIRKNAARDAGTISDKILASLKNWTGKVSDTGSFQDDITLIVLGIDYLI